MELLYGMDDGLSQSLCARVKELSKDGIFVELCYRLPEQGKTVAKTFFKLLKKVLESETLDFIGYFNLLSFSGRWDATVREVSGQNQGLPLGRVLNGPIRNDEKLDMLFARRK